MNIIEVRKLSKTYVSGTVRNVIFSDMDLEIETEKFVAIIGKSGSGKSTLLNILGGLDRADSGEILVAGKNIQDLRENELAEYRARDIGFVFQSFNLIPVLSAYENIVLPIRFAKGAVDRTYIEDVMKTLEIYDKKEAFPNTLSGGEQQRVAIARALSNKPKIIFSDEPTGNLDAENGARVLELLVGGIHKYHQTLVMVTHDMDIAAQADSVVKIGG